MARKHKLDKVDRQILYDLQKNGRLSNVELAKNAGISAPPCLRRVRALEDAGRLVPPRGLTGGTSLAAYTTAAGLC